MKLRISLKRMLLWLALGSLAGVAQAQSLQLVSTPNPGRPPLAGGGGSSAEPILSPTGRYVLFASSACNLALATNGAPMPPMGPAPLNVYLRDRTNGATTLVSVDVSGLAGGNDDSVPLAVSPDGRYALFESVATNLVSNDTNGALDVFLRDVVAGVTTLISVSTNGGVGNGESRDAVMTPDGRHVAFVSAANNLVAGDTNLIADVFVRDVIGGTTMLASVGAISPQNPYSLAATSEGPIITPDGRYVAFYSTATNLVPGIQADASDIYVRDLIAGTTLWASSSAGSLVQSALRSSSASCFNQALSTNGQYVAYQAGSGTSSLVLRYNIGTGMTDLICTNAPPQGGPPQDGRNLDLSPDGRFVAFVANSNYIAGSATCILLWDAQSGLSTLASGDTNNLVATNTFCDWPAVAPDGHLVCFISSATGLTTNPPTGGWHVFARDFLAGATTLLDADTNGQGSAVSLVTTPTLSPDGSCVVFACNNSALVPNNWNVQDDLYARTLATGQIELISAHDATLPTVTGNGSSASGSPCAASADGRYVAFATEAGNLAGNATNRFRNIVVRDLSTGSNVLASVATNGLSGDGISGEPAISADGRYVAFSSSADNLVPGDTNKAQDVFLRDSQLGLTSLVSVNSSGAAGNSNSYSPVLSTDGRYVLFRSEAKNLAAGTFSGTDNLFLRDLSLGTTWALTTAGFSAAAITPDGKFVVFTDTAGAAAGKFYLWNTLGGARISTNTVSSPLYALGISADGSQVAYWAGTGTVQLWALNRAANTTQVITSASASTPCPVLRFSANGAALVYNEATSASSTNQVYVYSFQTGSNMLASHAFNSSLPASANSHSPDISADGRFVAYGSAATNLLASAGSSAQNIYLYDSQTGLNTLLSANQSGTGPGNSWSFLPTFTADGRTLLFQTWASDLVPQDYNQAGDVMAFMLLYVSIQAGSGQGQPPCLSWPASGSRYRVQYKNSLQDATWQNLGGTPTNRGATAYLADPTAGTGQRFYRVTTY
jgi:Tol biopolymer transport system component